MAGCKASSSRALLPGFLQPESTGAIKYDRGRTLEQLVSAGSDDENPDKMRDYMYVAAERGTVASFETARTVQDR